MEPEEDLNSSSSLIRRSSRKSMLPSKFKDDNFITQIKPVNHNQSSKNPQQNEPEINDNNQNNN